MAAHMRRELLVHALLLPHMIEGTEPVARDCWRKDLQYHKGSLGEMIYSSYLELKPNIPKLVKELTGIPGDGCRLKCLERSAGAPDGVPSPRSRDMRAERVHFATRD